MATKNTLIDDLANAWFDELKVNQQTKISFRACQAMAAKYFEGNIYGNFKPVSNDGGCEKSLGYPVGMLSGRAAPLRKKV